MLDHVSMEGPDAKSSAVGTGPFMLTELQTEKALATIAPSCWGEEGNL